MPTFHSNLYSTYISDSGLSSSSLGCISLDELIAVDVYLSRINAKLILKFHQYDPRCKINQAIYKNIRIIASGVHDKHGSEMYGVLSNARALITDCSSVIFDFMLTGRPIAIDEISNSYFKEKLNFYIEEIFDRSFSINNLNELLEFIDHVIKNEVKCNYTAAKFNVDTSGPFCLKLWNEINSEFRI
jgi:hypothetical protein